jgi:hypothetical protein
MDVTEAVVRSGASKPSTMDIGEELIQPVRDAVAFGADLLIGYPPGAPEFQGGTGVVLALMESSDEAIFLTPCTRDNATATLINVAKDYGGSVVEFVRRVVDPSSPEAAFLADATAPPTTLPWEERDPDTRLISPGWSDAPQEIYDKLVQVPVLVVIPAAWNDLTAAVCFKISLAWSEGCIPTSPDPTIYMIYPYAVPGESMEVWLLGDPAYLDEPLAKLTVLEATDITEVAASLIPPTPGGVPVDGLAFQLTLTGDPASIEVVKEAVAAGTILAEVKLIPFSEAQARNEAVTPQAVPAEGP